MWHTAPSYCIRRGRDIVTALYQKKDLALSLLFRP